MDAETQRAADSLRELEQRYERARSRDFGPISKAIAEERDVLAAKIQHEESKR